MVIRFPNNKTCKYEIDSGERVVTDEWEEEVIYDG